MKFGGVADSVIRVHYDVVSLFYFEMSMFKSFYLSKPDFTLYFFVSKSLLVFYSIILSMLSKHFSEIMH